MVDQNRTRGNQSAHRIDHRNLQEGKKRRPQTVMFSHNGLFFKESKKTEVDFLIGIDTDELKDSSSDAAHASRVESSMPDLKELQE